MISSEHDHVEDVDDDERGAEGDHTLIGQAIHHQYRSCEMAQGRHSRQASPCVGRYSGEEGEPSLIDAIGLNA